MDCSMLCFYREVLIDKFFLPHLVLSCMKLILESLNIVITVFKKPGFIGQRLVWEFPIGLLPLDFGREHADAKVS